jgi:DnaJ-class molecular chaperone
VTTLLAAPSRLTLNQLVVGAWKRVTCDEQAECPVCQGEMAPENGAHTRAIGGRCTACGTVLR